MFQSENAFVFFFRSNRDARTNIGFAFLLHVKVTSDHFDKSVNPGCVTAIAQDYSSFCIVQGLSRLFKAPGLQSHQCLKVVN